MRPPGSRTQYREPNLLLKAMATSNTNATSSNSSSTGRKGRKPSAPPEILSVNGQPQEPQQSQEDACQAPAATFDLDAYMASAIATAEDVVAGKRAKKAASSGGSSGESRQRVEWPQVAQAAASKAGLRLPGLYPKPGSKSYRGSGGAGWYRDAGNGRPPGRNAGVALLTLWERIGKPLAAGQILPTAALFATIAAIKAVHAKDNAQYSEWLEYIVAPSEPRADGSTVGQATCILHQVALMAGSVIMTPETIRKV